MNTEELSPAILRRLPIYLHYLTAVKDERKTISSSAIAAHFGLNDVQVRKDLGAVSGSGRPKTGYDTAELIGQIEASLGCRNRTAAVLVGAGNLGRALLSYPGFADYGLCITAAFDVDPARLGAVISGKPVLALESLEPYCRENRVGLGVIAVPIGAAQATCDRLTACGVRAIWNFAPTILRVPAGVWAENENLASSLAILLRRVRGGGETT